MRLSIPVYVESRPGDYKVRPLFFPAAVGQAAVLGRAMARLETALRRTLDALCVQPSLDELAAVTFSPDLETHTIPLRLETHGVVKLLVVTLSCFDRRIAHVPAFPSLWLDVERNETLAARVEEMVVRHLRAHGDDVEIPEGRMWLSSIDVHCRPPLEFKPTLATPVQALLGDAGRPHGATELRRVGRCLDRLYPEDLERSVRREREVGRLVQALALAEKKGGDRRPVLVLGPRRGGKTALIHEAVCRRIEAARPGNRKAPPEIWQLAPQRLISGMMFVGQWEARLVAILDHVRDHGLILYFDDLLGLFSAGRSASADLSVADVLKPYVERRDVRVLAEITPTTFGVLKERDRGLADMFEVVPLDETSPADTLRIVLDCVRRAEQRQKVRFVPEAIVGAIDLQRRYVRDAVFPGKACVFVRHLAARKARGTVTRDDVLAEFHGLSGMSLQFLDNQRKLTRDEVLSGLRRDIIGQGPAVDAMTDAVMVAKARLADASRPLASLLFLGPTGVGKTQCARALARFLFGDASRMVRFDMNEFVSPDAVSRLIGTFDEPAGLLTAAVRQTPFCVLLLDEIEKAHPAVFNLLLQVLGDGRLTDALGRTVDFSHAIVIMTSNLGVREAARPIGFRTDSAGESLIYQRAAERFFAPEFFNRLDRVVPFAPLSRDDLARIARLLMGRVLAREGLLRRQCILGIDRGAFEAIVDAGFHPVLGARALKRAIERQVAQPIAARLAGLAAQRISPDGTSAPRMSAPQTGVTYIALFREGDEVTAAVRPLRPTLHRKPPTSPLDEARRILDEVTVTIERMAPPGPLDAADVGVEEMRYYRLRDGAERLRRTLESLATRTPRRPTTPPRPGRKAGPQRRSLGVAQTVDVLTGDVMEALREAVASAPSPLETDGRPTPLARVQAAWRDARYLRALAVAAEEEALIWIRGLDDGASVLLDRLVDLYAEVAAPLDLEHTALDPGNAAERAVTVRGMAAWRLLHAEHGTHLFFEDGRLQPVAVVVQRVPGGTAHAALDVLRAGRAQWVAALRRGDASVYEAPHPIADVVRVYGGGQVLDLRSGLAVSERLDAAALRELILGGLE